ncbi:hypothetical protein CYR40_21885 [Chimaeribacter arupi]|uniref:Glucosyl transferase GtrII family protein n=2 Tax=Yersiniaceae TaxID=1903411 RepID=A0A2N5EJE8_9GAMM|nr:MULTISPECIES: glucosyltransferase domain-containing protein [Yersiniaceae]MBS0967668.1 glucosyltransferase domain-containing protein [Nissabacter archeti]MDV5140870.1 glucosyltransferase domain-containing protein [Chimaeribacter arupi]PLR42029.1 hypothetical protein CYR40_21885 [Chimaeribacter arupi]PLR45698.1 hypothetical protein CYR34_17350 [Chimaeribacter arupi]PLR52432.1 hypothetical protein CYR52_07695 [Chimaeribacter arupi]
MNTLFCRSGIPLFLTALVCAIIVYGFELTHFTLSIDEEFSNNYLQTIALGRWGHALLRLFIFPEPYAPWFTTLCALLFASAAAVVMAKVLQFSAHISLCFVALFIALPQFAYQLQFSNQADTVGLGFLSAALSVYYFKRATPLYGLSIITYVFAISIYQSLAFLPISLILLCVIKENIEGKNNKQSLLTLAGFAAISVLSVIAYELILLSFQHYYQVSGASYFSSLINWGKLSTSQVISQTVHYIADFFTFNGFYGLQPFSLVVIPFLFLSFSLIYKKGIAGMVPVMLLVGLLFSPFVMPVISGGFQAPRVLTSLSLVMAGLFSLMMMYLSNKAVNILFSAIILLIGSASASQLFYSDYMSEKADSLLATQITTQIYQTYPDFNAETTGIYFFGMPKRDNIWKKPNSDVFGYSFFTWDGGNNARMIAYYRALGIASLHKASETQLSTVREQAKTLPVWPAAGSIAMINNVLVIKLGEHQGVD